MNDNSYILLLPVIIPVIAGALIGIINFKKRCHVIIYVFAALAAELIFSVYIAVCGRGLSLTFMHIADGMDLYLNVDNLSAIFIMLVSCAWMLAGIFSFEYIKHENREKLFFGEYLVVGGILTGLAMSGNMMTLYVFYEFMSITSMPMVLHSRSQESIMAALKYLFYSMGGAFMALFGFFVLSNMLGDSALTFTAGGMISAEGASGWVLAAVFLMILGFGTKAGMLPMHAWLPAAHPVAPAPASAVLSGVITKAGVLGVIRTVYYVAGPELIKGTWVQYAWVILALTTVFMGSMLAYKEKILKKRLAYSTVSQVSYVMFGLSLLNPYAFIGAILHVIFHSLAKNTLFMSAGAIIYKTGKTKVNELTGIGKEMPVVMWCFLLSSLSLVGIPPLCAFVSKWYLAVGALESGIYVASWLGPVVLLISALLTAGYLLPIAIKGFLPGKEFNYSELENKEPNWQMLLPLLVMTAFSIIFGIWPSGLVSLIEGIALSVF